MRLVKVKAGRLLSAITTAPWGVIVAAFTSLISSGALSQNCTTLETDTTTYKLCKEASTYQQARNSAEAQNVAGESGYLAIIDSASENTTIRNWLINTATSTSDYSRTSADDGGGAAYVWLGGDDQASEGRWVWQKPGASGYPKQFWQGGPSGSARNGLYNNWGTDGGTRNEPDNYLNNQDGVAIALQSWPRGAGFTLGSAGQWNDVNTSNRLYYLVEFDAVAGSDSGEGSGSGDNGGGASDVFRVSLEEPVKGETHMGVGNLRGWAVATGGITKVEIRIDGSYAFDIPYGGARTDVGGAFPDVENSTSSGFSAAYNYSDLSAGEHTITAVAHKTDGGTKTHSATFNVVKFNKNFISGSNAVSLGDRSCTVSGDEIGVLDARVDGVTYDLQLKWRTAEQGFEIIEVAR